MSIHTLRPCTDLVKLHPDEEVGALTEAVFAIDPVRPVKKAWLMGYSMIPLTDPNPIFLASDP